MYSIMERFEQLAALLSHSMICNKLKSFSTRTIEKMKMAKLLSRSMICKSFKSISTRTTEKMKMVALLSCNDLQQIIEKMQMKII